MKELKPCPFCGSKEIKVILEHDPECGRCWYVRCEGCYAHSTSMVECWDKQEPENAYKEIIRATEQAMAAWNRRKQDG